jgi:hypothetical protein
MQCGEGDYHGAGDATDILGALTKKAHDTRTSLVSSTDTTASDWMPNIWPFAISIYRLESFKKSHIPFVLYFQLFFLFHRFVPLHIPVHIPVHLRRSGPFKREKGLSFGLPGVLIICSFMHCLNSRN